jgi:acyl-CoA thioester hydrolase
LRGPLVFSFANVFLTPQGSADGPKVSHESRSRKSPKCEKCRFLGLFRPFEAAIHRLERASHVSSAELVPTFTTAVNTWQCDENDHLNVQYYTEFAHEASAFLLHRLGIGPRVQRASQTFVSAQEDHIRYLREFRVVDAVEVKSAPVEISAHELVLYHEVRNPADGTLAATLRRRVVSSKPWPAKVRERADSMRIELPAGARPRSVGTPPLPHVRLEDAEAIGLIGVGRTVIKPAECDDEGRFLPRHQFGRYSDAAPWLWNHLGFDRAAMQQRGEGTVVVETLHSYRAPLQAGNLLVIMSGLADYTDKILKLVHFAFDAESGTLAACSEGIGMKFDQKNRKIMTFSAEDQARLAARKVRF